MINTNKLEVKTSYTADNINDYICSPEFEQALVSVTPSPRQLQQQALEFYAFIHLA